MVDYAEVAIEFFSPFIEDHLVKPVSQYLSKLSTNELYRILHDGNWDSLDPWEHTLPEHKIALARYYKLRPNLARKFLSPERAFLVLLKASKPHADLIINHPRGIDFFKLMLSKLEQGMQRFSQYI